MLHAYDGHGGWSNKSDISRIMIMPLTAGRTCLIPVLPKFLFDIPAEILFRSVLVPEPSIGPYPAGIGYLFIHRSGTVSRPTVKLMNHGASTSSSTLWRGIFALGRSDLQKVTLEWNHVFSLESCMHVRSTSDIPFSVGHGTNLSHNCAAKIYRDE